MIRERYIPYLQVAAEWASLANELPAIVLRRLSHWAVAGEFDEGAFIDRNGKPVDRLGIYMSYRVMTTDPVFLSQPAVYIGDKQLSCYNEWNAEFLAKTLIATKNLLAFCHAKRITPPPCVAGRLVHVWAAVRGYENCPPECPDGDQYALRIDRRRCAEGNLHSLRQILALSRGEKIGFPRYQPDGPFRCGDFRKDWLFQYDNARAALDIAQDASLEHEFKELRSAWETLEETERRSAAPSALMERNVADERSEPEVEARRGRPPGAGSYSGVDADLVEGMWTDLKSGKYLSVMAAADAYAEQASGASTILSRAKRLAKRYREMYPGDN